MRLLARFLGRRVDKFCPMKKVIISTKQPGFWVDLESAAGGFRLSVSTVSRKIKSGEMRYVDRVFAVRRKKEEDWIVAVADSRGGGFVVLGDGQKRIRRDEVWKIKELTGVWYTGNGTEIAKERD
jgi:hypothetical protein